MKSLNLTLLLFIFFNIFALHLMSCSNDEDEDLLFYNVTKPNLNNIAYGSEPNQNLDIFLSDNTDSLLTHPVIIYVHGGGWSRGDKTDWKEDKVKTFRDLNYISVSINYRLVPEVIYPDNLIDVIEGINWIYNNIKTYGGDPHDITLVGHSSGAHLVASVVCDHKYLCNYDFDCHDIHMVCLLDGGGYLSMNEAIYSNQSIYEMVKEAINNNDDIWDEFGPANAVKDCTYLPPFLICHSDDIYRVNSNKEFIDVLNTYNFCFEEYELKGYSHNAVLEYFPLYQGDYDVLSNFTRFNQ